MHFVRMDFSPYNKIYHTKESQRLGTYAPFLRNSFRPASLCGTGLKSGVIISIVPTELFAIAVGTSSEPEARCIL